MCSNSAKITCFDLEGPLSAEDYAFRLFSDYIQAGDQVFAALSRYDDILTSQCRVGYEPGDTLALILPFLIAHGVSLEDIRRHAKARASVLTGAAATVKESLQSGREIRVITTSYAPFAQEVCHLLGLDPSWLYSTRLTTDLWTSFFKSGGQDKILKAELDIRERFATAQVTDGTLDTVIVEIFDELFLRSLPSSGVPYPGSIIRPTGGRRKALYLEEIARDLGISLSRIAYVGDSITDSAAFKLLDAVGGLGIAFNGNEYALSVATVGVASPTLTEILPLLAAWEEGGREAVWEYVQNYRRSDSERDVSWLPGCGGDALRATIARHAVVRKAVRADAAALGLNKARSRRLYVIT